MTKLQEVRVRYSRTDEDRTPKNTLYTHLKDGDLYFGIARCNHKLDRFNKTTGTHIAEQRALKALADDVGEYRYKGHLILHSSGLRGKVRKENAKSLIEYFRAIDEVLLDQLNNKKLFHQQAYNELNKILQKQQKAIDDGRLDEAPIQPASSFMR